MHKYLPGELAVLETSAAATMLQPAVAICAGTFLLLSFGSCSQAQRHAGKRCTAKVAEATRCLMTHRMELAAAGSRMLLQSSAGTCQAGAEATCQIGLLESCQVLTPDCRANGFQLLGKQCCCCPAGAIPLLLDALLLPACIDPTWTGTGTSVYQLKGSRIQSRGHRSSAVYRTVLSCLYNPI